MMVPILLRNLMQVQWGENRETKSKGKGEGIAKDGSSPYKKCQITQNKKKRLVWIIKVSIDVVKLWNELKNGSRSSNSLAKEHVNLVVQKIGIIRNHQQRVVQNCGVTKKEGNAH